VKAAVAERAQLLEARPPLAAQLAQQQQLVAQLGAVLAHEQSDLDRFAHNVNNFLHDLLGGRPTQAEVDVKEAAERLRLAHERKFALEHELAALDARLAQLASAPGDLAGARADKEKELGPRTIAELQELDIQVMSIDIELAPLQDAMTAGTAALAAVVDLGNGLDELVTHDEARKVVKATRAQAESTEEKLRAFEHQLSELAIGTELPPAHAGDTELSAWSEALFHRGNLAGRITAAREDLGARIVRLRARIAPIEARHRELSARRSAVFGQRDEIIDSA
jgi:hypothetical protein